MKAGELLVVDGHVAKDAALEVELHDQQSYLLHGGADREDLGEQALARLAVTPVHLVEHAVDAAHLSFDAPQAGPGVLC
jgi:hypothetical protein